jgi:flagellar biosynthesis/type III secretory pathway protein FliH
MTTTESQTSEPQERPKVSSFKPKAFEPTSWKVISQDAPGDAFEPLLVATLNEGKVMTDPMFEDYSEISPDATLVEATEVAPQLDEESFDEEVVAASELEELARHHQEEVAALQDEHERKLNDVRAEAVEQGRSEALEQLKAIEANYASLIEDLNTQIVEKMGEVERQAVEFAVQVARKLMGVAIEANPEYIVPVIREAIQLTGGASIKAIRVSPPDLELIAKLVPERQFKEFDGTWSFIGDENIRHGCVVETNAGNAEYDLEKAWERVKEQVLKVR